MKYASKGAVDDPPTGGCIFVVQFDMAARALRRVGLNKPVPPPRKSLMEKLCKAEILSRTADSERRTLLVNLINKAMKTVEDRNRVAHGYWFFIQSGPMNVHASRTTLRETGYFHDPNELVEKAKEIQELRDEIWERFIVEAT